MYTAVLKHWEDWVNIIVLKNLTYPKARRLRADCGDNTYDSLLCPSQSRRLPQLILKFLFWLSILLHPCSQLWVWFPHFVWDWVIILQHQVSTWCDLEFFILLDEPIYKDFKMNDLPFGILSCFQNLELDHVLTGCKGTSIKLPSPDLHRNQNPLANLQDPSGKNTVLGLRLQTRVWSYLELSSRERKTMSFFFYVLGFPSCFTVNDAPKQSNYCSSSGITIVIDEEAEAYGGKVQGCWVLSVGNKNWCISGDRDYKNEWALNSVMPMPPEIERKWLSSLSPQTISEWKHDNSDFNDLYLFFIQYFHGMFS